MFGNDRISPELLLLAGSSLAGGQTVGQQLGGIGTNVAPLLAQQAEQRKQLEAQNKTLAYLKQTNPQLAAQVEAGMPVSAAWQQVIQAQQPKKPNLMNLGNGYLYNADSGQYMTPPEGYNQAENGLIKRGLTPIWGMQNGKRVLGTLGEDGSFKPVDLPQGFEPTPGTSTVDLGTSIGIRDNKSGAIINTLPKDISGVEQQKVTGKTLGENQTQLPATLAKADQTIKDIDEALTHPGLESATGWQSVFPTMNGTSSADFEAKLDKLKGGAFLEAFQSLKGGGQITEVEGKKATDAIAVLSTSQSDKALRQALYDLREVIAAGRERAMRNAGQPVATPDASGLTTTSSGVRWKKAQ